jgi:hypothetical protein
MFDYQMGPDNLSFHLIGVPLRFKPATEFAGSPR